MQEHVIIVAAGSGSRMKSDIPKQFLQIHGTPVLMHTIRAFRKYSPEVSLILVLPENQFGFWAELCEQHAFAEDYLLVKGGKTRFHSVKNGLQEVVGDDGLVAVHDGVRPIISENIIAEGFQKAAEYGTAVVSVTLKDSIRQVDSAGSNNALDRTTFRLIQTPQTFRLDWMRQAFSRPYQETFTDCASVLESAGYAIYLIEGSYENIKITTPEDLLWAEVYLRP